MTATFTHQVRYHEVDQQGYLFNGHYFAIADVAHTELVRALGWTYDELNTLGADPSVVHIEADFKQPARFDDVLTVHAKCTRVGNSSFDVLTVIQRDDVELAQISTTYVNVDSALDRAASLPAAFANALQQSQG